MNILERLSGDATQKPMAWPLWKRSLIVLVYSILETFVLLLSTSYLTTQYIFMAQYHVSSQVFNLGASMNVVGNAIGVAVLGPLSDSIGRKWIYIGGTATFAIWNLGLAYPLNFPMIVIFMFLAGVSAAPALSNVAATVADLFGFSAGAAQLMAFFVAGGTVGPVLGSLQGYWTLQAGLGTKWIFLAYTIIGVVLSLLLVLVPETFDPSRHSQLSSESSSDKQPSDSQDEANEAPGEVYPPPRQVSLKFAATIVARLYFLDPIVLTLGIYNGIANGILLVFITGTIIDYISEKSLSVYDADLNALSSVVSLTILILIIPIQTFLFKKYLKQHGQARHPESRFLLLLGLIWLFPAAILWSAFTSGPGISFWSQLIAVAVVAFVDSFLYLAQLNYITDCYTDIAGSAIAAFLIPAFVVQAAVVHLYPVIFGHMALKWALAMLGFITLGFVVPGMYLIYFFGPAIRAKGSLARQFK